MVTYANANSLAQIKQKIKINSLISMSTKISVSLFFRYLIQLSIGKWCVKNVSTQLPFNHKHFTECLIKIIFKYKHFLEYFTSFLVSYIKDLLVHIIIISNSVIIIIINVLKTKLPLRDFLPNNP